MSFFIAAIPQGLKDHSELRRLFSKFKRTMDDKDKLVRWVQADMWHVTMQFMGDLNSEQKADLVEHLKNWQVPEECKNMELRVQGVGAFPDVFNARVLWLGIQKNQSLIDANNALTEAFKSLNLPADERQFNPHLTLARFRNPLSAQDLLQLGGRKHFGDYKVTELLLMESVIQGNMAKYIPVMKIPLSPGVA